MESHFRTLCFNGINVTTVIQTNLKRVPLKSNKSGSGCPIFKIQNVLRDSLSKDDYFEAIGPCSKNDLIMLILILIKYKQLTCWNFVSKAIPSQPYDGLNPCFAMARYRLIDFISNLSCESRN